LGQIALVVHGKLVGHHFDGTPPTPDKDLVNWNENTDKLNQAIQNYLDFGVGTLG